MELEEKLKELIKSSEYIGKDEAVKQTAVLTTIEAFVADSSEADRKQVFYDARETARQQNEVEISALVEAKKLEFNSKWQGYEDNDFSIPVKEPVEKIV